MANCCKVYCPEAFVLDIMRDDVEFRAKYEQLLFKDYVDSNPFLRFCPGIGCTRVIFSKEIKPKAVTCVSCHITFWSVDFLNKI